jgi:hypothetical protein
VFPQACPKTGRPIQEKADVLGHFGHHGKRPTSADRLCTAGEQGATVSFDPARHINERAMTAGWPTRADASLAFREPKLARMQALWRKLERPNHLPARSEFTARLLRPYMVDLTILRVETNPAGQRFVHKFIGGLVTTHVGELTGLALEDVLPSESALHWSFVLSVLADGHGALRLVTRSYFGLPSHVLAEVFAAPLADDGTHVDRIMMVTHFSSIDDAELMGALRDP